MKGFPEKFFLIFNEKDRILEEKNKVIFMLQQRVWELEAKLKTMVALPDYAREKQETIIEKQKLEEKIGFLKNKIKNPIYRKKSVLILKWKIFKIMNPTLNAVLKSCKQYLECPLKSI